MATKGRIETMTKKALAENKEFSDSGIEADKSATSGQSDNPVTGEDVLKTLREKGVKI